MQNNTDLAQKVVTLATERKLRISTAESCTGGLISAEITNISGASNIFDFGFVTYSNTAKMTLLGVAEEVLIQHGAVSSQTAESMARGCRSNAKSDIAVSVTGIAGPSGGSDEKPVGLVFFGISSTQGTKYFKQIFAEEFADNGRKGVRYASVQFALKALLDEIQSIRIPS